MRLSKPVTPYEGESLQSVVTRAAHLNGFPRPGQMLSNAGLADYRLSRLSIAQGDWSPLAAFLGCDPRELQRRTHAVQNPGTRSMLDWFGTPIPAFQLERDRRRIPLGRKVQFHRTVWGQLPLKFCPDTMVLLTSECPDCGACLRWFRTRGLDVCENCHADLAAKNETKVPAKFHQSMREVAALMSERPTQRRSALKLLPEPIRSMEPGVAVSLLIELGIANLVLEGRLEPSSADAWRRPQHLESLDIPDLDVAWWTMKKWPQGLDSYLSKLPVPVAARKAMFRYFGPFQRITQRPRTHEHHAESLNTALKERARVVWPHLPPMVDRQERQEEVILLRDACAKYGVGARVARRLVPKGECLVGRTDGPKGWTYFHAKQFSKSVGILRELCTPEEASLQLGLAPHLVPELVKNDLLQSVTDRDAVLMSGGNHAVTTSSVRGLLEDFNRRTVIGGEQMPDLLWLLRKTLHPQAWTDVLSAIRTQELPAFRIEEPLASLAALKVPPLKFEDWLKRQSYGEIDPNLTVSGAVAARFTGWRNVFIFDMVRRGHVEGSVAIGRSKISLASLQNWALMNSATSELSAEFNLPARSVVSRLTSAGIKPTVRGDRLILWPTSQSRAALT